MTSRYNHVTTAIISSVKPNLNLDGVSLEASSASADDLLKDGWEIISVFPCVFDRAAAIVAVLGKN